MIKRTFDLMKDIQSEGGSIPKRRLETKIREITSDTTDPPRRFLEDLKLLEAVSFNYNITEQGKMVLEMVEKGLEGLETSKKLFDLVRERYQVVRYLEKLIAPPGILSFKKEDFEKFVIHEWLLDFGYEKDDRIDRENALAVAEFLGIIKWDSETKCYIVNKSFKTGFSDIEFLTIVRELANFTSEWATVDFCEKLQVRHAEYTSSLPDVEFILERLIDLKRENAGAMEFSPGWPTPPIPPAFAFLRFAPRHVATLRSPKSWKEMRSSKREDAGRKQ